MTLRKLLGFCKYTSGEPVRINLFDNESFDEICSIYGDYEALKDHILDAEVESVSPGEDELDIILILEG